MNAINPYDKYVIFNNITGDNVESWPNKGAAMRACHVLNTNESRNFRKECFYIRDRQTGEIFFNGGFND